MNIPQPLPDEHVLGWRGRIRLFSHHPNAQHTIAEIRSLYQQDGAENQSNGDNLSQLTLLAAACDITPSEFSFQFPHLYLLLFLLLLLALIYPRLI